MATSIDQVKDLPPGELDINDPQVQDVIDDLIRTKSQIETAVNEAEDAIDTINATIDSLGDTYVAFTDEATQAEMEAGTATGKFVSPANIKGHPSIPKVICVFDGDDATTYITEGVSSVSRTSEGDYQVNFSTNFSNTNYCISIVCDPKSGNDVYAEIEIRNAGSVLFKTKNLSTGADLDSERVNLVIWGDQ